MKTFRDLFKHLKSDIPSGVVVFFVALPLCLAIGQVSTGRPELVFTGIIAGIIGGIIVGALSGSAMGVSGPAAGLVVIVFDGIQTLSPEGDFMLGYRAFLLAILFAGIIQLIAGFLKAGIIGNYFPSSVIKGMLAAIGITIILKELPHALGYDKDFMGDESFLQSDGHNTFTEIYYALIYNSPGAIIISVVSLGLLMLFERPFMKQLRVFKVIPAALLVVVLAVCINMFLPETMRLSGEHLVQLPVAESLGQFAGFFTGPDFSAWKNPEIYKIALTLAIIASIETLLSLEAGDKLDPEKRISPGNRELKAQGIGNIVSGLIGGLPVTQVIVRTSANIGSGAKSKMSTIVHGVLLLLSALFIPRVINLIPLAALASVLILIGYKLARVSLFRSMYRLGWNQFIPFVITIAAIITTDLLKGIAVGMLFAFFYIIRAGYRHAFLSFKDVREKGNSLRLELSDQVTFLNKGVIIEALENLKEGSELLIDGSRTRYIDHDVLEVISEFCRHSAVQKNIRITTINLPDLPEESSAH